MNRKHQRIWAPAKPKPSPPGPAEKQAIITACDAFVRDVLKPRFLTQIKPTE